MTFAQPETKLQPNGRGHEQFDKCQEDNFICGDALASQANDSTREIQNRLSSIGHISDAPLEMSTPAWQKCLALHRFCMQNCVSGCPCACCTTASFGIRPKLSGVCQEGVGLKFQREHFIGKFVEV